MERQRNKFHIEGVLVLLLTGVFAVCILLVLLFGADSYRKLTTRDAESFEQRIGCEFVAAKVRHADAADCVWVGDFSGAPAPEGDTLILTETVDGAVYWTRIYAYDGWVRELYGAEGDSFLPEDGEKVLQGQTLCFALNSGLLSVTSVDGSGHSSELALTLRGGEGKEA